MKIKQEFKYIAYETDYENEADESPLIKYNYEDYEISFVFNGGSLFSDGMLYADVLYNILRMYNLWMFTDACDCDSNDDNGIAKLMYEYLKNIQQNEKYKDGHVNYTGELQQPMFTIIRAITVLYGFSFAGSDWTGKITNRGKQYLEICDYYIKKYKNEAENDKRGT